MNSKILDSFIRLKEYCEKENYSGWDPYDGLNSKIFKHIPFVGQSAVCRLVWIQLFKRNPINLRRLFLIGKEHNAKGIALFLTGYCNIHEALTLKPELKDRFGDIAEVERRIMYLGDLLLSMRSKKYDGISCWGYNFPWQCRREFLFPAYEPTVVATQFCASALASAYRITGKQEYREAVESSARFVTEILRKTPHPEGFVFSYSGMPGNDTIVNASLMGSKLLMLCNSFRPDEEYADMAEKSIEACVAEQNDDGSWKYGLTPATAWIDSFHTGYNLECLSYYCRFRDKDSVKKSLEKGTAFYIENFFKPDGSPKYYHDRQYPIDIHCPAQLPVTLSYYGRFDEYAPLVEKVLEWTIDHMQHPDGHFYYQLKKGVSSRISYMRWSNAFMFYGMSFYLKEIIK